MKQITIAGNVGKAADIRTTQNGDKIASFSVAVSDRNKNTTWFDCGIWGKRGEALAQYLTKGAKVTVCGELSTREHEGKTYLSVRVDQITLQGGKPGGLSEQQGTPTRYSEDSDDIPF